MKGNREKDGKGGAPREAMLYDKLAGGRVRCRLCAHLCRIAESRAGVCRVRRNEGGTLVTTSYGRAIAAAVDPIEKKPLYHFMPGSRSFSIAARGCNFQCGFCQNWRISQAPRVDLGPLSEEALAPVDIVDAAAAAGCLSISYTYTEPTIFFEYAHDTACIAKSRGLANAFVTNGYMTKEAVQAISPFLDAANIDLKSFRDAYYKRTCKARLQPVLDSITAMKKLDIWVEVTTLVVPGENDSSEELSDIARFIAATGREIPWHISRFHPDFKYADRRATPIDTLRRAFDIGREAGLRFVYLGNVSGGTDTHCPECGALLIRRSPFSMDTSVLNESRCPSCEARIEGVWTS
jgi:pyruvate formate lyase activating enzyme